MLQYTTTMHRKYPGYEVKAIISFSQLRPVNEEYIKKLNAMRLKLEQMIPGNFRVKYNINSEELVIGIKADNASQAQSTLYKLDEFIKVAGKALNFT